ncbi:hypothetical protein BJF86_05790 [Serinicoccus sp. CNJ-927]|uniref:thioesterase family protein n=1 Tax=Serinicoccus sp. CNJ-927 TaxID=1904970 RepID=UPI0009611A36|nr:thioesterase family protein [Serinicoccus sp. CNJ-927]OLT40303.1 hypothetical protein BJF86_05790 [Serinicoccus sp. CNJ-927]
MGASPGRSGCRGAGRARRWPRGYAADLTDGWAVGGGLNGGYLLAVNGNALRAANPTKPDPISMSAHYLSASVAGPATVQTRTVREGRSTTTVAADLVQGEEVPITALATYGDLCRLADEVATTADGLVLPPPEECVPNTMAPEELRRFAPTMELTAHVRAVPAPGWLRVRHATCTIAGGMFEEDCGVWDSAGRLVAQSRQLARAPR